MIPVSDAQRVDVVRSVNTVRVLVLTPWLWLSLSVLCSAPVQAADEEGKQVTIIARTMDNAVFDTSKMRGKLVFVAVWATWCPICLGELPELNRIYIKYHGSGLEMIALNLDDDESKLKDFLKKSQFAFPVARRFTSGVEDNLDNLEATPVFYLVGKDGRVVWRRVGPVVDLLNTTH